jgi:hypothetical protein
MSEIPDLGKQSGDEILGIEWCQIVWTFTKPD